MEDDKRKYLRFECLIPIEMLEMEDAEANLKDAVIDNVSREGIRLVLDLDHAFKEGDSLSVQVSRPDEKRLFQIDGEVVWAHPLGNKLEVGLKIKDMERCTKADLLDMGFQAWRRQQKEQKEKETKKL